MLRKSKFNARCSRSAVFMGTKIRSRSGKVKAERVKVKKMEIFTEYGQNLTPLIERPTINLFPRHINNYTSANNGDESTDNIPFIRLKAVDFPCPQKGHDDKYTAIGSVHS